MSDFSKYRRGSMRDKAKRLTSTDPHQKVDASSWTPPEPLDADIKTGLRPISKRAFKRGGKVSGMAKHRADRKPRKSGGEASEWMKAKINRNVKDANEERKGIKHVGGMKRGGRSRHANGDRVDPIGQYLKDNPGPDYTPPPHDGGSVPMPRPRPQGREVQPTDLYTPDQIRRIESQKKHGGKAAHPDVAADKALIRKMVKKEARTGRKEGGSVKWIQKAIKHPGALHKSMHVAAGEKIPAKKLTKASHSTNPTLAKRARLAITLKKMHHKVGGKAVGTIADYIGSRPTGGRTARAAGGRTKGKTNVNIIIAAGRHPQDQQMQAGVPPMPIRPAGAMPVPVGAAPGAMGAMGAMGAATAPAPVMGGMPPVPPPGLGMPRKAGGRVGHRTYRSYKDMDAGSGGGLGRLEKTEIEKRKR